MGTTEFQGLTRAPRVVRAVIIGGRGVSDIVLTLVVGGVSERVASGTKLELTSSLNIMSEYEGR